MCSKKKEEKKKTEFHKVLLWLIMINCFGMMWASYVLAWYDKVQIAETLSTTVATTIISSIVTYLLSKTVENISKYGSRVNRTTAEFDEMYFQQQNNTEQEGNTTSVPTI